MVGHTVRTTNGGMTWSRLDFATFDHLRSIDFMDETNGLIVGWEGVVLETTDAGASWDTLSTDFDDLLLEIAYSSANVATAVGTDGVILQTSDNGVTWTRHRQLSEVDLLRHRIH